MQLNLNKKNVQRTSTLRMSKRRHNKDLDVVYVYIYELCTIVQLRVLLQYTYFPFVLDRKCIFMVRRQDIVCTIQVLANGTCST